MTFEAGYDGLVQQDRREDGTSRSFNAFDASLSLSSKDKTNARAGYHLDIDYRTGNDALTRNEQVSLSESVLSADASLFLSLKKRNRFCLDFDYDMAGYSGYSGEHPAGGGGEADVNHSAGLPVGLDEG